MKCVKDCYFLKQMLYGWYCELYEKSLEIKTAQPVGGFVVRCKECERGETLYHTRIKEDAKKRMAKTEKIER